MKSSFAILYFAGIAAVLVTAGCSTESRKDSYLKKAEAYYAAEKFDEAEVEYLNVIRQDGSNARAISQLALLYYAQGRSSRVYPFLIKSLELNPENLEIRVKLAMLYLAVGDFAGARTEALNVLEKKPDDPEAPSILAEGSTTPEELAETRRRLNALPPDVASRAPVLLALGVLEYREGKPKEAEALFRRAEADDPKSSAAYFALGSLYWQQGDLAQAEPVLKKASEFAPIRSRKALIYAEYKIRTGDLEEGKKILADVAQKAPDLIPVLLQQAEVSLAEKKPIEAEALVAKALTRDPQHPEARMLDARVKLAKGETAKAVTAMEEATIYYSKSAPMLYHLALAYVANQEPAKAITSLNKALTLTPKYTEATLLLADLHIRRGETAVAIPVLRQLVIDRTDLPRAWLLLGDAYSSDGSLDNALTAYRQLGKMEPKRPEVPLYIGVILGKQNKRVEARQEYARALELQPNYMPALEQLVSMDALEGKFSDARNRVEKRLSVAGLPKSEQAELHVMLARVDLAQKNTDGAEAELQKAIDLQPESTTAYYMLAQIYVSTDRQAKAITNLDQVVSKDPQNGAALMLIGVIQQQVKDYKAAAGAYEKLIAINPKFAPALNNLAWVNSENLGNLDQAYELAKKARELAPSDPNIADTYGWILFKRRQYPAALSLLQESTAQIKNDGEAQFHAAMAYYMMGNEAQARAGFRRSLELGKDAPYRGQVEDRLGVLDLNPETISTAARSTLEKRVADQPEDPIAAAKLGAIYSREGATDKAVAAYEASLKANPANANVTVSLARIYSGRKEQAKALELAKNARKLAPDSPEVAYELGRFAYETRDFSWSASLLQEAAGRLSDNPEVEYDYAQSAYAIGRVAEAEAATQKALANPGFSRANSARGFVEMVGISNKPVATAEARVDEYLKTSPDDLAALYAKGAIVEQKPDRPAAIAAYEKIIDRYPDFSPAKKRLVILYSTNSANDQKAYAIGPKAREAFPNDVELSKAFGAVLYRRGDLARAVTILKDASDRAPDADTFYYLGMTYAKQKNNAPAIAALERSLALNLRTELSADATKTLTELKAAK